MTLNRFLFWWIWLLLFIVILAFGLSMIAMNAEGHTEIFDIKSGYTDYGFEDGNQQRFAVAPSNRWYVSYLDEDGDFKVSWSDDLGSTWDDVIIQSDGWKGESMMNVHGVYCWANNTTCVILRTEGADNAHDVYLFYLWGQNEASDPSAWNYTLVYGGPEKFWGIDARFNRSGVLYIFGQYSSDIIKWRSWNVSTGTFNELIQNWGTFSGPFPKVQVDHNDNVFILYGYLAKTWCIDIDKTMSMSVNHQVGGLAVGAFFITEDNTKVFTAFRQYLSVNYKRVYYEIVTNTSFTYTGFGDDTDDWETGYSPTGNVHGNTVSLIMLRLETGSEEYVKYEAQYDAVEATWSGSETVLFSSPTDDDRSNFACGANSVWPKISGISVSIPTDGTVCWWVWRDEKGVDDDFYDILYWNDDLEFQKWIWSPGPTITTASLPDGTVDVFYSYTLSAIDGELPYSWSFVTAPAWLNIGSSNGTIYGMPASTGSFTVRARVTDDVARTDDESWELDINVQPSPPGRALDFPVSMDTLMAAMWWIFIVLAMFIAVMDVIVRVRNKASRGFK